MVSPSVTWPSPAMTALSLCRIARIVVEWKVTEGAKNRVYRRKKVLSRKTAAARQPHVQRNAGRNHREAGAGGTGIRVDGVHDDGQARHHEDRRRDRIADGTEGPRGIRLGQGEHGEGG